MEKNISIDSDLLEEALNISGLKTKKETVNQALKEFVERRKQCEIKQLFGEWPHDPDYDYKKLRN